MNQGERAKITLDFLKEHSNDFFGEDSSKLKKFLSKVEKYIPKPPERRRIFNANEDKIKKLLHHVYRKKINRVYKGSKGSKGSKGNLDVIDSSEYIGREVERLFIDFDGADETFEMDIDRYWFKQIFSQESIGRFYTVYFYIYGEPEEDFDEMYHLTDFDGVIYAFDYETSVPVDIPKFIRKYFDDTHLSIGFGEARKKEDIWLSKKEKQFELDDVILSTR